MATQKFTQPAPEPSVTICATSSAISGYTAAQLKDVLEVIAGRAATLHQLIILSNSPANDDFVRGVCGDAAEALATAIGCMADAATGGEILGTADRWNYGPKFVDAGKAVQS